MSWNSLREWNSSKNPDPNRILLWEFNMSKNSSKKCGHNFTKLNRHAHSKLIHYFLVFTFFCSAHSIPFFKPVKKRNDSVSNSARQHLRKWSDHRLLHMLLCTMDAAEVQRLQEIPHHWKMPCHQETRRWYMTALVSCWILPLHRPPQTKKQLFQKFPWIYCLRIHTK